MGIDMAAPTKILNIFQVMKRALAIGLLDTDTCIKDIHDVADMISVIAGKGLG